MAGDVDCSLYGGSCTAGKKDDFDMYAAVMQEAREAGLGVADGVRFYIQFGSEEVEGYARDRGYLDPDRRGLPAGGCRTV